MGLTRKQTLLKLIVEDFIKTAEPVGSNYLIQKYNLNISSATIRNEMNALEKEGLLEKTHTSSGRVPSNEGYKYYIENLRNSQIDENVKNEINTIFSKTASVDEVLKESCEILSTTFPILHFKPNSISICLAKKDFERTTIMNMMEIVIYRIRLYIIIILSHYNNIISYIFYKIKRSKISHDFLTK